MEKQILSIAKLTDSSQESVLQMPIKEAANIQEDELYLRAKDYFLKNKRSPEYKSILRKIRQIRNEKENYPSTYYYEAMTLSLSDYISNIKYFQELEVGQKEFVYKYYKMLTKIINKFKTELHNLQTYLAKNKDADFDKIQGKIYYFSLQINDYLLRLQDKNYFHNIKNFDIDKMISRDVNAFFRNLREQKYKDWCKNSPEAIKQLSNINCVALAYPTDESLRNELNSYFSLSGSRNDYKGQMASILKLQNWDYLLQDSYVAVKDLLKFIYGYDFIECHLEDNTNRYTEFSLNPNNNNIFPKKVLDYPTKLENDIEISEQIPCFSRYYSCCEKKIVSKMGFVNTDYQLLKQGNTPTNFLTDYTFKIKSKPCNMCRPALIGCNSIYFKDSNPHSIILDPKDNESLLVK